jgi:hypothetical protein
MSLTILPRQPSLDALLGQQIGSNIVQGYQQSQQGSALEKVLGLGSAAPQQATQVSSQQMPQQQKLEERIKQISTNPQARRLIDKIDPSGKTGKIIDSMYANQLKQEKVNIAQKQYEESAISTSWEKTRSQRNELTKAYHAAKDEKETLDRMQELNEEKDEKLINPAINALLQHYGIEDWAFLKGASSQEMDKLSNDFLNRIKPLLGAQISAQEVRLFMKGIPTLMQTKEGRKRIIAKFKDFNDRISDRYKSMREITKKYEGQKAPFDFLEQVEDLTTTRREKFLSEKEKIKTQQKEKNKEIQFQKEAEKKLQSKELEKGVTLNKLPTKAPEGAIFRKGEQKFIYRGGKWQKYE